MLCFFENKRQAGSKKLGLSPQETMKVAERLYLMGYVSYPRTETTSYPKGFPFEQTLQAQINDQSWGNFAKQLLKDGISQPRRVSKKNFCLFFLLLLLLCDF